VNEQIRVKEVRLISPEGEQIGIVTIQDALGRAHDYALDLVEVAPEANPPVCKIVDFNKLLYDQKRKLKDAKRKTKTLEVKELKVRPKIDPHDYIVKLNHAKEFLEKGHKVKITLVFRGREMMYQEAGEQVLQKFIADTHDIATAEMDLRRIGKTRAMILSKK
jgi:translation initiation factor IF-3